MVDDGSTDNTLAVARGFERHGVLVVTQPNAGAATARNRAFSLCQGDFIQWLDADDLLAPGKIELQLKEMEGGHSKLTLLSCAWGRFMYRSSKARFVSSLLWRDLPPLEWLLCKWENSTHMLVHSWLVSRELTEAAGPWDTRLSLDDDGEYFCRVIIHSDGIKFVPDAKVFYRTASFSSLSNSGRFIKGLDSLFLSLKLQIGYVLSVEASDRTRAACVQCLQKYMFDFHPERPDLVAQIQALASQLNGELREPTSSWKYQAVHRLFGWQASKRLQLFMPMAKSLLLQAWDKTLFNVEGRPGLSDSK